MQLAEVEGARALIAVHLAGRRIVAAEAVVDTILFDGESGPALAKKLVGRTVVGAGRKGKYFWMELDRRPWPLFHFGMTGQDHLSGVAAPQYKVKMGDVRAPTDWPPRFLKLELVFDNGQRWAYTDPRRLGRIRLVNDPLNEPPVSLLGFDPLLAMPTVEQLRAWFAGRTAPIKAVLLDQTVAAGVGNWIADEVLYQAGVHPELSTALLTDAELQAVHDALERIVRVAVDCKLTGKDNPTEWLYHYRWSKRDRKPQDHLGNTISFVTVGGRTSAVVSARQRMRKTAGGAHPPAAAAGSVPGAAASKRGRVPVPAKTASQASAPAPKRRRTRLSAAGTASAVASEPEGRVTRARARARAY